MKFLALLCCVLAASACTPKTPPEPEIRIKEVILERPIACIPPNLGDAPDYPDSDDALAAASPDTRYALLWAGRLLRVARLGEVEPVITICREAGGE